MFRQWINLLVCTVLAAAAMLSTASAVAAPKGVAVAQRLAAEAKTAYLARDYGKAAALYAEAVQNFAHADLHFMHGRSLEQLGQFRPAGQAFGRAGALSAGGPTRDVIGARAAADAKLDEAQQQLLDGNPTKALPMVRAAHAVLFSQSRRAEDGQVYPEPAAVLLLLARAELATGGHAAAQQILVDVVSDPTAPAEAVERAKALNQAAAAQSSGQAPAAHLESPKAADEKPPAPPPVVGPVKATPGTDPDVAEPPAIGVAPPPSPERAAERAKSVAADPAPGLRSSPPSVVAQRSMLDEIGPWAVVGLGLVGLGLGAFWNLDYNAKIADNLIPDPAQRTASMTAYGAGGVFLVGGLAWWWVRPEASRGPQ